MTFDCQLVYKKSDETETVSAMTVITVYVTRLNYSHLYDLCVGSLGSCFYEAHNPNQPKCLFFVVAVNNEQPIMSRVVLNAKGCSLLPPASIL